MFLQKMKGVAAAVVVTGSALLGGGIAHAQYTLPTTDIKASEIADAATTEMLLTYGIIVGAGLIVGLAGWVLYKWKRAGRA